mmetsp:Transcript_1521/g.1022  ORF Transcript_1521/g.1022 Transcript_1521/m.1022 type:complete len:112 (+) Transcript_1521:254-589(+)
MSPPEFKLNLRVYNHGDFYSSKEYGIPIDCYEVNPDASAWISELIGRKIVLLRAVQSLTRGVSKKDLQSYEEDDQVKGNITCSAMDVENEASREDLIRYVQEKYKGDPDTL